MGKETGRGDRKHVTITINPRLYPLDVIYSAAYVFLDNFYIIMDGDPETGVVVKIFPKDSSDTKDIEKRFNNELVNYAFYKRQVERNADIRKAIIQRALVTSELSGEHDNITPEGQGNETGELEGPDADYIEDPEGIAIPWEEKFGKKAKGGRKGGKGKC